MNYFQFWGPSLHIIHFLRLLMFLFQCREGRHAFLVCELHQCRKSNVRKVSSLYLDVLPFLLILHFMLLLIQMVECYLWIPYFQSEKSTNLQYLARPLKCRLFVLELSHFTVFPSCVSAIFPPPAFHLVRLWLQSTEMPWGCCKIWTFFVAVSKYNNF